MKKKIILVLSMLSLLVCIFAVSVSASDLNLFSPNDTELVGHVMINMGETVFTDENGIEHVLRVFQATSSEMSDTYFAVDPSEFQTWIFNVFEKEDVSYEEFFEFKESANTDPDFGLKEDLTFISYWGYESAVKGMNEDYFNRLMSYKKISQEDLTSQYNQGKTDGVTEYKESEEYTTALETKYQAGLNDFKESEEYSTALENAESDGYIAGTIEGVAAYKLSEEYNNALKDKYTTGYNDGVESVENTEGGSNVLGIVFGSVGIGVVVLAIFCGIMALRKRPKVRR